MILLALACAEPAPVAETACVACDGVCVESSQEATEWSHVDGEVDYADPPPMSGDHASCWAEWGAHADEVPAERWVHNLEHGGVVFLFDCDDTSCLEEAAALEAWAQGEPDPRWLVSPYAGLGHRWAAVAWEHRIELGCFDLGALADFYTAHVGHGREDVTSEPAEECME